MFRGDSRPRLLAPAVFRVARAFVSASLAIVAVAAPFTASAQTAEDTDPTVQCLRYVQSYERSMRIPSGLLVAISYVESGRPIGPNNSPVAWPWTINVGGRGQYFETKEQAVQETRRLMDEGQRSIDVGCMQINLRYHPNAFRSLDDAFDPATNVAYGAQYLQSLHNVQGSWQKAVERYHSSDDGRRAEYRDRILDFWNRDARDMIMNAVLAEDTNTPYHHALNDFAAGRYEQALDKYQALVDQNPKDRLGLLGVAMSYDKLSRESEAARAYERYLITTPENESVMAQFLQTAAALPPADARVRLEGLVRGGVQRADVYATLSEVSLSAGDNDNALRYMTQAIGMAPNVAMYQLNAGILADRMSQPATALNFYENFLRMFTASPVIIDASIDGIRSRVQYLRAQL